LSSSSSSSSSRSSKRSRDGNGNGDSNGSGNGDGDGADDDGGDGDSARKRRRTLLAAPRKEDDLSSSLPDIAIIYKLYERCGRTINLYDFYNAFTSIVNSAASDDGGGGGAASEPELQARFLQATSELQLMGLIKANNRKVDHVSRLSFVMS
jgi:hypothetical protein